MDIQSFEKQLKKKERVWDTVWLSLLVVFVSLIGWASWYVNNTTHPILVVSLSMFVATGLFLSLVKVLSGLARRTFLKTYWIEDQGDVIKLYGSVWMVDFHRAYRELLSIRPGYKIVNDAHKDYGCTIAAVRATDNELQAKQGLSAMGIKTHEI